MFTQVVSRSIKYMSSNDDRRCFESRLFARLQKCTILDLLNQGNYANPGNWHIKCPRGLNLPKRIKWYNQIIKYLFKRFIHLLYDQNRIQVTLVSLKRKSRSRLKYYHTSDEVFPPQVMSQPVNRSCIKVTSYPFADGKLKLCNQFEFWNFRFHSEIAEPGIYLHFHPDKSVRGDRP